MSAEIGFLFYKEPGQKLKLGQRVEIVPNNATLTINIHDQIYGVRNGAVEETIPVTGRGRGN
jgi:D-serine deaminase-like pyridoxal phosphate-dependent protein